MQSNASSLLFVCQGRAGPKGFLKTFKGGAEPPIFSIHNLKIAEKKQAVRRNILSREHSPLIQVFGFKDSWGSRRNTEKLCVFGFGINITCFIGCVDAEVI